MRAARRQASRIVILCEGAVAFDKFLRSNEISVREAARQIAVSHVTMLAWISGELRPTDVYREKIAKWTGGKVGVAAWRFKEERAAISSCEPFKAPPRE